MKKVLDVLICTINQEGIERVASARHPEVDGVRYLVAWQMPNGEGLLPDALANREDFVVKQFRERGLSRNRNRCIEMAEAEWCLISDDDISYSDIELTTLIDTLSNRQELDIVTIKYHSSAGFTKIYPAREVEYANCDKGYYVSSIEIVFRRSAVQGNLKFNERFGIGAPVFKCGEEDIFIHDCLNAGLSVRFIPITVGSHPHTTTTSRDAQKDYLYLTKGAVYSYIYPSMWWLRITVYGIRAKLKGNLPISLYKFIKLTFRGAAILNTTSSSL